MISLLATASYWALIILWSAILAFYLRKLKQTYPQQLFFTLILILALDAFRTLAESVYFGLWYTSLEGFLPASVYTLLTRPHMVIIPKLFNIAVAVMIIGLLIKRWIPQEEQATRDASNALLESEARFHAFSAQTADGIGVTTVEGKYTYVNPAFCEMTGYTEGELLTMTVFDLRGSSQVTPVFEASKATGNHDPVLAYLRRKDGSEFLAEIMGNLVLHGESSSVFGVVRDVTERERAAEEDLALERQVQHGQKLESLGILAGGIAHDFNNVLTAILGNASLAKLSLPENSAAMENLEGIESAAQAAADLTKQMLDYSGKGRFIIETIDPRSVVESMMQLLTVSVSKKIETHFDFDERTPTFRGDGAQVRQVVMNLITNASEAIGHEVGDIWLSTGAVECSRLYLDGLQQALRGPRDEPLEAGTYAYIEVKDTGCGMDEDTRRRVFEPFFSTKFTGRGLGMASVLGILRGHGAGVDVQSAVGLGTTMRVLFPASNERADEEPRTHYPAPTPMAGTARRILIADDEDHVRRVGEHMLQHQGHDVLAAVDGEDAVRMYQEHADEIACVLLDLTMPRMDGAEVLRAIREIDPGVKVILCSGDSEQDAAERFGSESPDAFLHKPYDMRELKLVLRKVL